MKILYCIYQMGVGGGVERVLTSKANYLKAQGHDVRILTCCPLRQAPVYGLDPNIPIDSFDIDYASDFRYGFWRRLYNTIVKMWKHWRLMHKYLRGSGYDVVVTTHIYETAFLPFIKDGSKKVLECHSSKMMYKMQRQLRTISWTKYLVKALEWRDKLVHACFDAVVCLTEEDRRLRGSPRNMLAIPNPLSFVADVPSACVNQIVLAVGRLSEEKDYASLLDIWSMLCLDFPTWRLLIVGDGALRADLKSQIEAKQLVNYVSLEPPTDDPRSYYAQASIYVMTSTFEGFGLVLTEAQTYGLPIVSYACPCGPRDIVSDGTGYLVEPGDKQSFADKLRLLMQDQTLCASMGQAGRRASHRYELEPIMSQWLGLFQKLISKK